ncbi:MAG TPA: hypothetical protein PLX69_21185 [Leptospiraceae bacterium]|nr:hypothetical protein [Leptospiraceae bacterium]HRG77086.1 hypothetical protein [Leptospiraceae bacterium]
MANKRRVVSKELEAKAANLGTIFKDKEINVNGITGDLILSQIASIELDSEKILQKEREILAYREQLKTKRENLFNIYHNAKSYFLSRARTEPELKGLISTVRISHKRKKKENSLSSQVLLQEVTKSRNSVRSIESF